MATSSAVSFLATLQSFFRDLLGNLPDGVNDTTEGIRRDGHIGLFVDPLSSLDINGSLGTSIRTDAGAAVTVTATDFTVVLSLAALQTVTLPAVATSTRRIIALVNPTSTIKTVGSYTNLSGAVVTSIPANSSIILQSNGTVWRQIVGGGTSGVTLQKFRVVQALVLGNNTITHSLALASTPVMVEVRDNKTGAIITARVVTETANTTVIDVGAAVASARITIIG